MIDVTTMAVDNSLPFHSLRRNQKGSIYVSASCSIMVSGLGIVKARRPGGGSLSDVGDEQRL